METSGSNPGIPFGTASYKRLVCAPLLATTKLPFRAIAGYINNAGLPFSSCSLSVTSVLKTSCSSLKTNFLAWLDCDLPVTPYTTTPCSPDKSIPRIMNLPGYSIFARFSSPSAILTPLKFIILVFIEKFKYISS